MSYSFRVFKLKPGEVVEAAVKDLGLQHLNVTPTRPLGGETCWALDAAIGQVHGAAQRTKIGDTVEYSVPSEGVQIMILESEVAVTVALQHEGEKARQVLGMVWDVLNDCEKRGLTVYDPQAERALMTATDFAEVLRLYTERVAATRAAAGAAKRPWWKFWAPKRAA